MSASNEPSAAATPGRLEEPCALTASAKPPSIGSSERHCSTEYVRPDARPKSTAPAGCYG